MKRQYKYENYVSDFILKKLAKSQKVRILLQHLGKLLFSKLVEPLDNLLKVNGVNFSKWPPHYKKALVTLCQSYSGTGKQYGSFLSFYESDDAFNGTDFFKMKMKF